LASLLGLEVLCHGLGTAADAMLPPVVEKSGGDDMCGQHMLLGSLLHAA